MNIKSIQGHILVTLLGTIFIVTGAIKFLGFDLVHDVMSAVVMLGLLLLALNFRRLAVFIIVVDFEVFVIGLFKKNVFLLECILNTLFFIFFFILYIRGVDIERYYEMMLDALRKGRIYRARLLLLLTNIAYPKCPDNQIMHGAILLENGSFSKAFRHLSKTAKNNTNIRITMYLGLSCLYLSRYSEAQEYFEKCSKDDQFREDANSALFVASYLKGDFKLCYRIIKREKMNCNELEFMYYRGILEELEGNYEDALCYYEALTNESNYYNCAQKRADVLLGNRKNVMAPLLGKKMEKRIGIRNKDLKEIIAEGNHPISEWNELEKKYWLMR